METLYKSKTQEEFVKNAFDFYRKDYFNKLDRTTYCSEDRIHWIYNLGRDYQLLSIDYQEFKNILLNKHKRYYQGKRCRVYNGRYIYLGRHSHYCSPEYYRVLRGFTYCGQEKKDRPSKNEWRHHKGINKDRRKPRHRGKWKRFLKESCKRKHRQFERMAIKSERYHKFHHKTYKNIEDSWNWD